MSTSARGMLRGLDGLTIIGADIVEASIAVGLREVHVRPPPGRSPIVDLAPAVARRCRGDVRREATGGRAQDELGYAYENLCTAISRKTCTSVTPASTRSRVATSFQSSSLSRQITCAYTSASPKSDET